MEMFGGKTEGVNIVRSTGAVAWATREIGCTFQWEKNDGVELSNISKLSSKITKPSKLPKENRREKTGAHT